MQTTFAAKIEDVAKLRHEKSSEVIAEAIEIGLSYLWKEVLLNQYIKRRISRKKAVQLLGLELVKLADSQKKIVQDDIEWGLNNEIFRP